MISFPNAKINLGLNIVSKRSDGYHNLETVFYPIPLYDALEVVQSETNETIFTLSGIAIAGNPNDNLIMKAYRLLKNDFDLPPVHIFLQKNIPFGAGLGGGSSDAAFMLKLLNDFAGLNLSDSQLEDYASRLGADCSFFIQNKPVFAEGTGNIFSPIELTLKGYYLLLIKPDILISTQEAYSLIKPKPAEESIVEILQHPVNEWKNRLNNDFEDSIFTRYPKIKEIKEKLYEEGAVYAAMSGSGSSVFGVFEMCTNGVNFFPDCLCYSLEL